MSRERENFPQRDFTGRSPMFAEGPRVSINSIENPEEVLYRNIQLHRFDKALRDMPPERQVAYMSLLLPFALGAIADLDNSGSIGTHNTNYHGDAYYAHNSGSHYETPVIGGFTGRMVDVYENFIDKNPATGESLYPDTPKTVVNTAQKIMGIPEDVQIKGGLSELWKVGAQRLEEKGASEWDKFVLAVAMANNIIPGKDGGAYHVYKDHGKVIVEELDTEQVAEQLAPLIALKRVKDAILSGENADTESAGGTPVPSDVIPVPDGETNTDSGDLASIDLEKQMIDVNFYGGSEVNGQNISYTDVILSPELANKVSLAMQEQIGTSSIVTRAVKFTDPEGDSETLVFATPLDSEGNLLPSTYFYAEENQDGTLLVPIGLGGKDSEGHAKPIYGKWKDEKTFQMGLITNPQDPEIPLILMELNIDPVTKEITSTVVRLPFSKQTVFTSGRPEWMPDIDLQQVSYNPDLPPTPIETVTPTSPEESLNLTLEDWKNMHAETTFVGDNGKVASGDLFLNVNEIVTDPERVLELKPQKIAVYYHSGLIEFYVEPEVAAQRLRNGEVAFIVAATDSATIYPTYSIGVAGDQYLKGNENVKVVILDSSAEGSAWTDITLKDKVMNDGRTLLARMPRDPEGRYIPLVKIENFLNVHVSKFDGSESFTLSEAGLMEAVMADPANWAQIIADAGFDRVAIEP